MQIQTKLSSGEFLTIVELEPPKGIDISNMLASANKVRGRVDAFVVPEMSNAVARMSSFGGSILLQNKGLNAIMQVCCRDRNRLALQADLLAAQALGIKSVMVVTGADISFGDHHRAREVYDINLIELLEAINELKNGRDMAGVELEGVPTFMVGSTVNSGASGGAMDLELEELDKKINAGTEFFVTPPVFDLNLFAGFMKKIAGRQAKIIPTTLLLKSVGMARYIDRNVENVSIPDDIITRIQKSKDRTRECVNIAAEFVSAFKEMGCSGVLIAPLGWEHKLLDILEGPKE